MKKTLGFLGAVLFALPAFAGDVQVEAAYAYPTAATGENSTIISMTLKNSAKHKDRLVSAKSPIADHTEVFVKNAGNIELAAGKRTVLTPQTNHIAVSGLKKPLTAGAMVPLVLTFEKAGEVSIEVPVKDMGAR
ncbi:MAG: copper chaperone PCu(A)C [Proteobacteria bacterium]|nr:copper chaperone PCu(A)C [Pseudomonadota bacterium]